MNDSEQRLSYKFQRLREQLRSAIRSGELAGKLPGERLLAQRFHVNSKTLSKALTDLAAEGLLDRTIGRGTFVRSPDASIETPTRSKGRWLLLSNLACEDDPVCRALSRLNADCEVITDPSAMRPSLVNQFTAVVDVHGALPDAVVRDLLLRSRRLVRIDAPPRLFSTHAVMIDRTAAMGLLVREFVRNGFGRLVIVDESPGEAFEIARGVVRRLGSDAVVITARPAEIPGIDGVAPDVAFIGASSAIASDVRRRFAAVGVNAPADVSIACVGVADDTALNACSGYAVTATQVAETVAQLLAEAQLIRPTSLWLVGSYLELGTVRGDDVEGPATKR